MSTKKIHDRHQQVKDDYEYHVKKACEHLRHVVQDGYGFLVFCVATICDVDADEMFGESDKTHIVHTRWLYWYAYRYITRTTCRRIAEHTRKMGLDVTEQSIARSLNKMDNMIEDEPMWRKSWETVRRIIKSIGVAPPSDNTIVISVPRELNNNVKFEIKEKK